MKATATTKNAATSDKQAAQEDYPFDPLDVYGLRDLLGLAAMAVEADRVLRDLEVFEPTEPALRRCLKSIDTWRQWSEYRSSLGGALGYMNYIARRLTDAIENTDGSVGSAA